MKECRKIRRNFILAVVWIMFITYTLCGIFTANARTEYNRTGEEYPTVFYNSVTENNKPVT
jgi:hypothetical protein